MKKAARTRLVILLIAVAVTMASVLPASIMAHPGSGIAVDQRGQVYFLDTGSGLWRIDTQGGLAHLSRLLNHWLVLDENNLWTTGRLPSSAGTGLDWEISKVDENPTVLLSTDWPIALGQDGSLYYQAGRPGHLRIMRSLPSGMTSVLAILPKTASGRPLPHVSGLAPGPSGSLYYTEESAIRRITAHGRVGTVATVPPLKGAPSIPATDTHPYLRGLAVDAHGVMYVADTGDARVLKITPRGKITTLIQTQSPWSPTAVALFGSDVYVVEFLHTVGDNRRDWLPRVRKISADGTSKIILTVDQMPGAR
jgi:hypothetical protein